MSFCSHCRPSLADGQWHRVAVAVTSTSMTLRVNDNVFVSSSAPALPALALVVPYVGGLPATLTYFGGAIAVNNCVIDLPYVSFLRFHVNCQGLIINNVSLPVSSAVYGINVDNADPNPCHLNPCHNSPRACTPTSPFTYECTCSAGWAGPTCDSKSLLIIITSFITMIFRYFKVFRFDYL